MQRNEYVGRREPCAYSLRPRDNNSLAGPVAGVASRAARVAPAEKKETSMTVARRTVLTLGVGAVALVAGTRLPALAAKNDTDELIKKFTGGKSPSEGRVRLDLPEIAENGNTVPMTVSVESPMTEQSYVTDVLVVASENPRSGVV